MLSKNFKSGCICLKIMAVIILAAALCSCGQKIDEDIVIENNATASVMAGDEVYEISDDTITVNGAILASDVGAIEDKLFVVGNGKVYFNASGEARYVLTKNGKVKTFGKGKIIYARGEWLYYENIGLYMVNVIDGKQSLLHETALKFKEETDKRIIFTDGEKDYGLKFDGTTLSEVE